MRLRLFVNLRLAVHVPSCDLRCDIEPDSTQGAVNFDCHQRSAKLAHYGLEGCVVVEVRSSISRSVDGAAIGAVCSLCGLQQESNVRLSLFRTSAVYHVIWAHAITVLLDGLRLHRNTIW